MTVLQEKTASSSEKVTSAWPVLLVVFLVTAAILFLVVPKLDRVFALRYSAHFEDGYDLIANNLINGNGYRLEANKGETMIREPGYPLFLAAVFKVGGYSLEAARFANWLLSIGIAILIMRLTRLVTNDERSALIASVLFLLYPGTIICEARGGVEVLFIFAILVFMLVLHRSVERGGPWRYLMAGLALGVVVQVRSTPMVFPLLLVAYLGFIATSARERLRVVLNVGILVLGMAAVMTPWTVRNYLLVHEFVPTATVQGLALQEGQYACQHFSSGKNYYVLQTEAGQERDELAARLGVSSGTEYYQVYANASDEWRVNNALLQGAKAEYVKHPVLYATCVARNALNFWFLGKTWAVTGLNTLIQVPLLILALHGLYLLWNRSSLRKMGIMLTFVLSILAVHMAIIAAARYSVPVIPFLAIPASISVMSIWRKCWTHARREMIPVS
jgi:4-amino-4-deoxy-L-arabinose transferase-like glycosyltransferase